MRDTASPALLVEIANGVVVAAKWPPEYQCPEALAAMRQNFGPASSLRPRSIAMTAVILLMTGACSERHLSTYADRIEAERAGAFARGWLPAFLPASSTLITEIHDIDSNERWGRFSFRQDDLDWIARVLRPLGLADLSALTVRVPGKLSAWPRELSGPLEPSRIQKANLTLYSYPFATPGTSMDRLHVAIDLRGPTCYFWSQL